MAGAALGSRVGFEGKELFMNAVPHHVRATPVSARLGRRVAGVLVLAGAVLAAAIVLAHRGPEAAPLRTSSARSAGHTASPAIRPASASEDTGPGFAESEVARLPQSRP